MENHVGIYGVGACSAHDATAAPDATDDPTQSSVVARRRTGMILAGLDITVDKAVIVAICPDRTGKTADFGTCDGALDRSGRAGGRILIGDDSQDCFTITLGCELSLRNGAWPNCRRGQHRDRAENA